MGRRTCGRAPASEMAAGTNRFAARLLSAVAGDIRRSAAWYRAAVKLETGALRLSATDLANHLACRHLTTLERGAAEGRWKPLDWYRPEAEVLRQRGLEHERAYLAHLERQGRRITRLGEDADGASALERTTAAMRAGAQVIAQATLAGGRWLGRADVLLRVERPSQLGAWCYEAL